MSSSPCKLGAGQQGKVKLGKSTMHEASEQTAYLLADSVSCASEGPVLRLDSRSRDACITLGTHVLKAAGSSSKSRCATRPRQHEVLL